MKILITGSSEGIGFEVAKVLASKGNQVTLVARNQEKLEKAISVLSGNGHNFIVADLGQRQDVDSLKEKITTEKYDVLINNAGVGMYGKFTDMELSEQVGMMNLNMTALTALSHFYLSNSKKGDALINIASTLGSTSFPGSAVYAGTKGYVAVFTESLWAEYRNRGVYVAVFCPGVTATAFHHKSGGKEGGFPQAITQTPEQVAHELVRALEKRSSPKIVSGFMNRAMLAFYRLLTTKAMVSMMAGFSPIQDKIK
jgi:short-subunit dehydrogenase